jgi:spermidine/putrescine transport system ATP-binding protein
MVKLDHVVKVFEDQQNEPENAAVKDITLDIKEGEFLTMLGPSGCGKTTTLRMIAGFEKCTSGTIHIDSEDVSSKAPYERKVNTVFQNYALFPHMNIFDNIAFGLTIKKLSKLEIDKRVRQMLKIVQMEGFENRMPDQLSGGQKQRVAIARAIINNPKVLLLDEPLGALDLKLRKQMQSELKHLQQQLGITFVYVTHDQEEALTMSDRICVMNKGLIEQLGTPDEIYEKPRTKFVADFIGETNIFEGVIKSITHNDVLVAIDNNQEVCLDSDSCHPGDAICFAVRPERLKLKDKPENGDSWLKVKLKERIYVGSILKTVVTMQSGKEVTVNEPAGETYSFNKDNTEAFITWNPKNAVVIGL